MGSLVVTDIISGTCVPWGAYRSYVAEKTLSSVLVFFTYVLPMTLTLFCYCRIVYALFTRKVIPTDYNYPRHTQTVSTHLR